MREDISEMLRHGGGGKGMVLLVALLIGDLIDNIQIF